MIFLLDVLRILFSGWVFQMLWLWFIVPLGFLPLTFANALGVALTIRFVTYSWQGPMTREDTLKDKWVRLTISAVALALGYIYSLFI